MIPKDEHDPHVVGFALCDSTAVFVKGPKGRLAAVISTENLLLNGKRATAYGHRRQILIDCEYSKTLDGWATMLIGVMSLDQKFHVVSLAVVNHEDEQGHMHCLEQTKKGVEAAARKYQGKWI